MASKIFIYNITTKINQRNKAKKLFIKVLKIHIKSLFKFFQLNDTSYFLKGHEFL